MKYLNNPSIVDPLTTAFYLHVLFFFFNHPQTLKKKILITSKDEKG